MGFLRMGTGSLKMLKRIMLSKDIRLAEKVMLSGGLSKDAYRAFLAGTGLDPDWRGIGMVGRYGLGVGLPTAAIYGAGARRGRGRRRRG